MPDEFVSSGARLNGRNFDYPMPLEGRMAKSYLWAIEKDARELRKKLQDDDGLPGWVQAKIVTAQDRIQIVNRYMGHKIAAKTGNLGTLNGNRFHAGPRYQPHAYHNPTVPPIGWGLLALFVGVAAWNYYQE
jgi:hypothetical protein